jgi:Coenzyme PQQ synthesis protein D (PqqD)
MTLLRLNETAVSWREVDGEIIALQHESSEYLSTKGSGALLWKSLASGASREHLIGLIVREFGVDRTRATKDTDAFLDTLCAHGLLAV